MEIVYYYGLAGLGVMAAYVISLIRLAGQRLDSGAEQKAGMLRYMVLLMFILLFSTLQGMIFSITYVLLYLSILAANIAPRKDTDLSAGGNGNETVC